MRYILYSWLIEFGPLLVFFFTFQKWGFFTATKAMMAATFVSTLISMHREKRIPHFPLAVSVLVGLFGAATIHYRNPQFLMFETTLYYSLFSLSIVASILAGKNILRDFFGRLLAITPRGWKVLAWRWAAYFAVQAVLNEYVRQNFSVRQWVHFRMAMLPVLFIFGAFQLILTTRERLPEGSRVGLRTRA